MNLISLFASAIRPLAVSVVCVLLAACSSDKAEIVPDVNTDPDIFDEPIMSSSPVFNGDIGAQSFELLEDELLRGRFYSPAGEPENPVVIRSLPSNGLLTLQPGAQVFVYTPDADFWGEDGFEYTTFGGVPVSVSLTVNAVNDAPVLIADLPQVAAQGQRFTHQIEATDADGDTLQYSAIGLPAWLGLNSSTGLLSGLPTQNDIGMSDEFVLRVSDTGGLRDEITSLRIEVIDVNDAPTLNLDRLPAELLARETVTARLYPDDPDGDPVTLDVEANAFVTGSASNGSVTLTASDVNEVMQVNVVIKATDVRGRVTREIVPLTLYPRTDSGRGITLSGVENGNAVHVVVLGDGYTIDQQPLFREHVEDAIENMRSDAGISAHFDALSIHMISTVSEDSGSDDNELTDARDTYYNSTYNCGSIQRLICADSLQMLLTAVEEYPDFDQVILLVNDTRYGGSGNSGARYAITSAYAPQIALHEMGHSLANLADEYVDNLLVETTGFPSFVEGNHPNVTAITDPAEVPWAHWIEADEPLPQEQGDNGVGLFEGGLYRSRGVFRPTFNSRMRSFDASFGPVNSEVWVLSLYENTDGGIRGYSPSARTVNLNAGESQVFVVSPIFGKDIQSVEWTLDGDPIPPGEDPDRLTLSPDVGSHTLRVEVRDISGAIRKPPPHAGMFSWEWQLEVQ
ncbi:M64 family metallopeptidase [Granulosicoccus sp. 3-233]|uniref:M64 family metallopeptidase n=1 Tax=Granulosicoccus sp. 3-233 TaxID=3417969 RepID=UPI003D335A08